MQLNPVYGSDPLIVVDGPPSAVLEPVVRQRRRLVAELGSLGPGDWDRPSRCEGWSARDVIVHLDSTNAFWSMSISAGVAGTPTTFLAEFDPVATPAELVAGSDDSPTQALEKLAASTEALCGLLESLDEAGWNALAETPAGHVSVTALAHHALWDSWIHERDVFLALGRTPVAEADEVAASLAYVAALSPAFSLSQGGGLSGVLGLSVTDPAIGLTIEVTDRVRIGADEPLEADLVLRGDAVELLEALSVRRGLEADVSPELAWMVDGLREAFDVSPS